MSKKLNKNKHLWVDKTRQQQQNKNTDTYQSILQLILNKTYVYNKINLFKSSTELDPKQNKEN